MSVTWRQERQRENRLRRRDRGGYRRVVSFLHRIQVIYTVFCTLASWDFVGISQGHDEKLELRLCISYSPYFIVFVWMCGSGRCERKTGVSLWFCRWGEHHQRPGSGSSIKHIHIFGSQVGLMVVMLITKTYTPHNKDRPSGQHSIRLLYWITLWNDALFSLSVSLSFPHSLLLMCLARFVVWAWFALKSVTFMGIWKLEWTKCIQLLRFWLFTLQKIM